MWLNMKEMNLKREKCSTRHISMCTGRPKRHLIRAKQFVSDDQTGLYLVGKELSSGGEGGQQNPSEQLSVHRGGQPVGGQVV